MTLLKREATPFIISAVAALVLVFSVFATKAEAFSQTAPFDVGVGSSTYFIVNSSGQVGIGTASPSSLVNLHISSGLTPALRFDQNTSGGFPAQIWDILANESTFSVRDTTAGGRLVFRIFTGAPTNSLTINSAGNVGLGTGSPAARLDVLGNVKVGSSAAPKGVTLFDTTNGNPYCLRITSGAVVPTAGACI